MCIYQITDRLNSDSKYDQLPPRKNLEQSYTDKKLLTLYIGSIIGGNFLYLIILYHRIAKIALFRIFSQISCASFITALYRQEVFQTSRSIQNREEGYKGVLNE